LTELDRPDLERVLEAHVQQPNVRGVRHIVNWHRDPTKTYVPRPDYLTDARWLAGLRLLERFRLSFDLQLYPSQMDDAARAVHACPNVQVVLDHTGMPVDRDPEAIDEWRRGMRRLAAEPNVAVKISGLGMVDHRWTVASIRPFVLFTLETFGIGRCMFASNFPVDRLYGTYDALFTAFKQIVEDLAETEQRRLFRDNAERIYRL
jgi:predicted TIM-barrel fold metal-dependent hydrolase